jgi:hypothetical protein
LVVSVGKKKSISNGNKHPKFPNPKTNSYRLKIHIQLKTIVDQDNYGKSGNQSYTNTSNLIAILNRTVGGRAIGETLQEVPKLKANFAYVATLASLLLNDMQNVCCTRKMKVNLLKEKAMLC